MRAKYEEVCAKLAKYEETAPLQVEEPDPLRFEWVIPGMRAKLEKWERGRAIHSPEFCLESVDDMMIEFFPRGDSTSYDGFCAVKIRVPDNTKIRWSFQIGEILSRCDIAIAVTYIRENLPDAFCIESGRRVKAKLTIFRR